MTVRFSNRALAQLDRILLGLTEQNPAAAQRFEYRIRTITERIGQFPLGFQEVAQRRGIRRVPLVQYPYLLFYKVFGDEAFVLGIVHGARKEPWEDL
jgi:plasmid stabilization system protein ParE